MRARRQIRPALPGFSLALPSEGSHGEVQVQQQNEREVDKFFIDVDDTMVSPMITTNPSKIGSSGTFNARPIAPLPTQPVQQPSSKRPTTEPPAGSYAAALSSVTHASHGAPTTAAATGGTGTGKTDAADATGGSGSDATATQANNPAATAKFIHVHNTNLFVLMDGVSMFFDGKSTYTGNQDPNLLAFLQKKKREKQEKKERREKEEKANVSAVPTVGSPVDTVEKAIRDIEENVANIFSPMNAPQTQMPAGGPPPHVPSTLDLGSAAATAVATPIATTVPTLSVAHIGTGELAAHANGSRPIPKVPSQFASLFANTSGPVGSPLFGHQRAIPSVAAGVPPSPGQQTPTTDTVATVSSSTPLPIAKMSPTAHGNGNASTGGNGNGAGTYQFNVPGTAGASTSSLADAHCVANSSFSSQASSMQAPLIRREGSSMSINALTETAHANASFPSVTNVRANADLYPSLPGSSSDPDRVTRKGPSTNNGKEGASGGPGGSHVVTKKLTAPTAKLKPVSMEDIGHSNRSLDIDDVEYLDLIGAGSQGKVFRVRLDGKLYALKCMDVREATEATNSVERQGRKRGLVKELNMIRLQRERPPPKHLMQMFNAVATLDGDSQQLSLLIELMSFGVEDCQKMVARIPQVEMMAMTQSTFRNLIAGDIRSQQDVERLLKQQNGSCMHVLGRNSHLTPQAWELNVERQTPMPEIVLSMLAADVLKGLRELHQDYGIVHCDLKPANVLLCFDRQSFKLADFGCSSTMNPETKRVTRRGVDLGSKLYKAPERLSDELANDEPQMPLADSPMREDEDDEMASGEVVEFSGKADVWSLGIMLLELSSGVHPCSSFKSDFWNYRNQLKLAKMVKPLTWSPAFCDFVVRCVCVDEGKRWSVKQLLSHPFVLKSQSVPRIKLRAFMDRLEKDSASFQRRQQRDALQKQIQLSTAQLAKDNHMRQSRAKWGKFNSSLKVVPDWQDLSKFPTLQ